MAKVNLVLFKPNTTRWKILDSYLEVIESLLWGLRACGHDASYMVNKVDFGCVNIVFGWIPAFLQGLQHEFPPDSILFNLEQMMVGAVKGAASLELAAAKFRIWDYSAHNLPAWAELGTTYPVYHAPISYAPTLERIPHAAQEDIDMLYIGSLGPKRAEKLIMASSGLINPSLVSLSNVWGTQRDEFIGRSKVLLNISNEDPFLNIFEVVRVSYYMANKKAVVCEARERVYVEPDLRAVLRMVEPPLLGPASVQLILDPQMRERYALECYEVFRQRDVRSVIRGYFD